MYSCCVCLVSGESMTSLVVYDAKSPFLTLSIPHNVIEHNCRPHPYNSIHTHHLASCNASAKFPKFCNKWTFLTYVTLTVVISPPHVTDVVEKN